MSPSPEGERSIAPPSHRQREVLLYIIDTLNNDERIPTLREIGKEFNISHVTAYEHVKALVAKGWVLSAQGKARSFIPLHHPEAENPIQFDTIG